jgi:hypothetical protein
MAPIAIKELQRRDCSRWANNCLQRCGKGPNVAGVSSIGHDAAKRTPVAGSFAGLGVIH